ncbi:MAG: NAD(P)/FAD-dependent oxidoreductase [Gammaproteobacteria bacterium]|nr:NAD(P)/FAD-dependent oxidoreductase [Gammaproteobacteria bacterium]
MSRYDSIIIGAGAAGLMCAITAAQRGKKILLLERSNKIGKKILMSGGGRCNFTNLFMQPENFLCQNPHFCKSALSQYTQWDFIALVEKHNIAYHEKTLGQLFCDDSSKDILNMFLAECKEAGVTIETNTTITGTTYRDNRYHVITETNQYISASLVVASGGLSIPSLGGSGYGYQLAKQFEHPCYETRAALVPFTFSDHHKPLFAELSGLSVNTDVTTINNISFREALLFTHRGLSGPAILQASSYWQSGEDIAINLLPNDNAEELLIKLKHNQAKSLLRTQLSHHLPKALTQQLETLWWPKSAERPLAEWNNKELKDIARKLNNWALRPAGTEGYRTAEVTIGGVNTDHLSSQTMESTIHKGLYFIGEVVDVTGHLGGFNFQWAWSSGYVAGMNV